MLLRLQTDQEIKNGVDVHTGMEDTDNRNTEYSIQHCRDLEAQLDSIKPPKIQLKPVSKNKVINIS